MTDPDVCEVVITAPDAEWLAAFTHRLLADHLIAGAHQIRTIRSQYRWRGELVDTTESRVAMHTRLDHLPAIIARADADHPYQVPCVVAYPITAGNPAYIRWVRDETVLPG